MSDESTKAEFEVLLQLADLTVDDDELRRLTTLHARMKATRDRLRSVVLGETEPATTLVSAIEMGPR